MGIRMKDMKSTWKSESDSESALPHQYASRNDEEERKRKNHQKESRIRMEKRKTMSRRIKNKTMNDEMEK
jgi:hypothetical protein